MPRIEPLSYDQLNEQQRRLWDDLIAKRPGAVLADGHLHGPLDVWLHAPEPGRTANELGVVLHSEFALEKRLKELAVITVAAHWKVEYAWWAHSLLAGEQGISAEVVEAIGDDREPRFASTKDRVVYRAARELVTTGTLSDESFEECVSALGQEATVELAITCGFFCLVGFVQNVASLRLPANASPRWPPSAEIPVP
jgi:4-carboxymuconolactone decarboxylase